MCLAEQICTPLSADLWDNLSPQASSMDVHNPHEACRYNGWTDARQPTYECLFLVRSETLNFELMWRQKLKKKRSTEVIWYYICARRNRLLMWVRGSTLRLCFC